MSAAPSPAPSSLFGQSVGTGRAWVDFATPAATDRAGAPPAIEAERDELAENLHRVFGLGRPAPASEVRGSTGRRRTLLIAGAAVVAVAALWFAHL